jgi:hypothetical protein
MTRIEDPAEQDLIVHSADVIYQLYGNLFRGLDAGHGLPRLPFAGEQHHAD